MSNFFKRTVPVILVLALCIICLFSPVSASSYDTGFNNYFNILDFDTHDDDNVSNSDSSLIAYFNYTLPVKSIATYVDVVISTASGTITSAYGGRPGITPGESGSLELNVEPITNRLFRVYGQIPQYTYSEIQLSLFTSAANTICTAQTFYVWNDRIDVFEETGILVVSDYDVNNQVHEQDSYGATCHHGMSAQTGTSAQGLAIAQFFCNNWVKYDFLSFYGSAYTSNITSVTANFNNLGIPFTINYLSGSVSDSLDSACSRRDFIITLDLRGLDRSSATDSNMANVVLQLPYPLAQGGSIALYRVNGIIQLDTFDTENYFFKHIFDELKLFRTNFFTVLGALQTNLSTWFTDLGNYLGDLLVTLNNNMNAGFTNIATKFNTLLENLGLWFGDVLNYLGDIFNKLNTGFQDMVSGFQNVDLGLDGIWMAIQDLINGSYQENQNAADFNDSVSEKDSELDEMTDVMDSVDRPELGDIDLSTNGMISINVLNASTRGLGLVLGNEIILRLLIMALTFALAGFILYGKR